MIKIKSHTRSIPSNILSKGDYLVKISAIEPCFQTENVSVPWADRTPQIAIKYALGGKSITQWISLKSYVTVEDFDFNQTESGDGHSTHEFKAHPISDIKYLVRDCRRVEDKEKSKAGFLILAHIAHCSGIPSDSEIELSDLVGRELLIRIGEHEGQLKVTKQFKRKAA